MVVYRALCGDAIHVGALLRGHQDGGHKITETEVTEFCYWNKNLK